MIGAVVHSCFTGLLLPQVTVPFQTESLCRESAISLVFIRSFFLFVSTQPVSEVVIDAFLMRVDVCTCAFATLPPVILNCSPYSTLLATQVAPNSTLH